MTAGDLTDRWEDREARLTAKMGADHGATWALLGDFDAWTAACDATIDTLDRLVQEATDE